MGFWREGPSYVLIAFSFVLLLISIAGVLDSYMYSQSVQATVVSANCPLAAGVLGNYNCNLSVSYVVNNYTYQAALTVPSSSIIYSSGDHITIYYNPSNPHAISSTPPRTSWGGILFFVCTLFLFVYSISFYFYPKWGGVLGLFQGQKEWNPYNNPLDMKQEEMGMHRNPYIR
jgi:hypothetical protein